MPADPPCPDLDALADLSRRMGEQWRADIDEPGAPEEQWTGKWKITHVRGDLLETSWQPGEHVDSIECALARGVAMAVNALPGLIAEVRRLRAALGEACDGWRLRDIDGFDAAERDACEALAAPARTDEAT